MNPLLAKHQQELIELLVKTGALRFGDFVTKSGRATPYFVNMGSFNSGQTIKKLGQIYAQHLFTTVASKFDLVFGPAYKAIPLAVATSEALFTEHNLSVGFAFNRKEAKDHGEGGNIVGAQIKAGSQIVIVEDVITAGSTLREILPVLRNKLAAKILAVVVAVDRCEKGSSNKAALLEVEQDLAVKVSAIVSIHQIISYLSEPNSSGFCLDQKMKQVLQSYLSEFGAK